MSQLNPLSRRVLSGLACASVLAAVIGCSDSGNGSAGPEAATSIYAINYGTTSFNVLQYPANSNGATTPTATIVPPTGFSAGSVATDSSGNVYLAGADANDQSTVLKYAKGSNGAATPTATLLGGSNFYFPISVVFDAAGKMYVLDSGIGGQTPGISVTVYAAGASGTAAPVRTLVDSVDNTLWGAELAVDAAGNVFVSADDGNTETGVLLEFASTANGTAAPTRRITTTGYFYGIAVDSKDNVYVADGNANSGTNGSIVKFGPTASGAATPSLTLTGSATGISFLGGVRLDAQDNLYAINQTPGQPDTYNVLTFKAGATGDATPMTVMSSTTLTEPGASIALY